MAPATPNAEDTLRRPAALLELLLEAVLVAEPEEEETVPVAAAVDPEAGVEAAPEPLVPPSWTELLRQEVELPAPIVTMSEYAVVPVLSFKAMVLHKEVSRYLKENNKVFLQAGPGSKVNIPGVRSTGLRRELLELDTQVSKNIN